MTISITTQLRALYDSVENLEKMNKALKMIVVLQEKLIAAYRTENKHGIQTVLSHLHDCRNLIEQLEKENARNIDS